MFCNISTMDLDKIQLGLGYSFQDIRLLKTALVHRSYLNERDRDVQVTEHNERLEFLGDAVLELVVTEFLFLNYTEDEGILTAYRSALVNYKTIGSVGIDLGLENEILLSKGEKEELGKARLTIVADCVEAVIGSMFLDGGIAPCTDFIRNQIMNKLEQVIATQSYKDFKTILQEFSQKHLKMTPQYKLISSEGKDHEKVFTIGVWISYEKLGEGEGRSKQDAETSAAQVAYELLQRRYDQGNN